MKHHVGFMMCVANHPQCLFLSVSIFQNLKEISIDRKNNFPQKQQCDKKHQLFSHRKQDTAFALQILSPVVSLLAFRFIHSGHSNRPSTGKERNWRVNFAVSFWCDFFFSFRCDSKEVLLCLTKRFHCRATTCSALFFLCVSSRFPRSFRRGANKKKTPTDRS